jgi:hypothetical protein
VILRGHRKRQVVTAFVALAAVFLFVLQWSQAPRVTASPAVTSQLPTVRGQLYLGETFEGLPLRTVAPFLYSDCEPGKPKTSPLPCKWVKVTSGRVAGHDPKQVARAKRKLRPVA